MSIAGKVVVVTGASMGIGEAIVQRFLREGASVVLASRDLGRVEAARQRTGVPERTLAVACDVRVRAQIEALLAASIERFGRVDVWVNNAGFGLVDSVERMNMGACRSMFDTNLFGAIECMQVVSPVFKQQRSGAIINISSMAGIVSVPYMGAYGATKHGSIASRAPRAWNWLPTEFMSTRSVPDMCRPISTSVRCGEPRACAWPATAGMA